MSVPRIGIVNVGMGNLRSVSNAFDAVGADAEYVSDRAGLEQCSHLVLPGVGAFATAMTRLATAGLVAGIQAFAASGRPVLGLCLGMQLLAEEGEEGGWSPGVGLVGGRVMRLDGARVPAIPHVGWNAVTVHRRHPVLQDVPDAADFYFVHSYQLVPADPAAVVATTDCGHCFASVVARANVVGCQFHPEKSQRNGLRILENFCDWDGRC